ncbi:MAG: DUF4345 family protein [Burkholderiales bacterium]|nr:DUF4345 family protein [Burkholderiales bacterium]
MAHVTERGNRPHLIRSDIARRVLLSLTALIFVVIAVRGVLAPAQMAAGLGYVLIGPNGYSEFYAIYLGVWLATAVLAVLAAVRVRQPLIGDLVAMFVLAQPAGRLLALVRFGPPEGLLLAMFALEAIGGLLILCMRPSA